MIYTNNKGGDIMMTAKIFENGRSQAVRLPKEYRFSSNEVAVNKIGNIVMLLAQRSLLQECILSYLAALYLQSLQNILS